MKNLIDLLRFLKCILFQLEYLIKWENYSSDENTWEKERDMLCDDLVAKFESGLVQKILGNMKSIDYLFPIDYNIPLMYTGVRKVCGGIEYLVELKNTNKLESFKSADAIRKLPVHVVDFLETKIEWFRLGAPHINRCDRSVVSKIVDEEPLQIHCK